MHEPSHKALQLKILPIHVYLLVYVKQNIQITKTKNEKYTPWNTQSLQISKSVLCDFWARSQFCEKQLLSSSCQSICLSVRMEQLESQQADLH